MGEMTPKVITQRSDQPPAGRQRSKAGNLLALGAVVLLAAGGIVLVVNGFGTGGQPPPVTRTQAAAPATSAPADAPAGTSHAAVLPASAPVSMEASTIGVRTSLMRLGLNPDRTVQTPPLTKDAPAGWYTKSPTPGQLGPAIILGHVDTAAYGPAVFFRLGELKRGDTVTITRADRRTVRFRVDEVARYQKAKFPTEKVYGNIDHAGLRLITCGGKFDLSARSYEDNTVVYASMIG